MSTEYVYELVDTTSDEGYYSQGIYRSVAEAVDALSTDEPKGVEDYDCWEHATFEVRRRPLNKWSDSGKTVFRRIWTLRLDDSEDEAWVYRDKRSEVDG